MPAKEDIGRLIPFYLRDKGITITEFSKQMNVSEATIYRWISGKAMFYKYYIQLLSVLRDYY